MKLSTIINSIKTLVSAKYRNNLACDEIRFEHAQDQWFWITENEYALDMEHEIEYPDTITLNTVECITCISCSLCPSRNTCPEQCDEYLSEEAICALESQASDPETDRPWDEDCEEPIEPLPIEAFSALSLKDKLAYINTL